MKNYQQAGLDMADDGAILVHRGDWLSKYSMVIYGNYNTLNVFLCAPDRKATFVRRSATQTSWVSIPNKNLIIEGETLLHTETFDKWKKTHGGSPAKPAPIDTDELLKQIEEDGNIKGKRLEHLTEILEQIEHGAHVVESISIGGGGAADFLELVKAAAFFEGVEAAATLIGTVLFVFTSIVNLLNALEAGLQYIGLRALAYGTTAWAYNDPKPLYPLEMELTYNPGNDIPLQEMKRTWQDTVSRAFNTLDAEVAKSGYQKSAYQLRLHVLGQDKKDLCVQLMKYYEKDYWTDSQKAAYWSPEPDYPNCKMKRNDWYWSIPRL